MTRKITFNRIGAIASSSWTVALFSVILALVGGSALRTQELKKSDQVSANVPDATPYEESEAQFSNGNIQLAGTLTMPRGAGPFPALVLTTGSGPQNRDAEFNGRPYHAQLARGLARDGIAVLRYDDRGVGASTGSLREATLDDLAEDAWQAVRWLLERRDIDPRRIGLYGPSEGTMIVSQVADQHPEIAFLVMASASGLPGRELMIAQHASLARALGLSAEAVEEIETLVARSIDTSMSAHSETEKAELLIPLARRLDALMSNDPVMQLAPVETAERMVRMLMSKAMQDRLRFDPRPALEAIRVPALFVHGERDVQMDPTAHLPAIEAAFAASGHTDYEVVLLPGLNHMLEPSETGLPFEYGKIPRSPRVLEIISSWIRERLVTGQGQQS